VRAYFAMTQRELALYLGISEPLLNHLEAARSLPSPLVLERLAPLLAAVPDEPAAPLLPTAPPAGPLDRAPLEARRDACLYHAGNLRWQARQLPERAQVAARWAQALPALRAGLPPAEAAAPDPTDRAAAREAVRLAFVRDFLEVQATALDPATLSQWHLLHLRAEALEAEAAALSALLDE